MKGIVLVLMTCLLLPLLIGEANSQVTMNALTRVLYLNYKGNVGTAFTIEVDDRQYLVTARHVVSGIGEKDTIRIFHEKEWKNLDVKVLRISPPQVDIAVLIPPQQLSPVLPLEPTMAGIMLAQQVYFLGFPYGLHQYVGDLNRGFPMPFVKSGVCAAIDHQGEKGYSLIYVDGMVNPGFSGGPLLFKSSKDGQFKVAGVVSSYRIHPAQVIGMESAKELIALENSGIFHAYSIATAVSIIKQHPEGPKVAK